MSQQSYGRRLVTDPEIYRELGVIKPQNKQWCINDRLYRYKSRDTANNMVLLTDLHNKETVALLWTDFIKRREPIYTVSKAADLLNRHHTWVKRMVWAGVFKQPLYATPDGRGASGKQGMFTQNDIYEMRNIMIERRARRKDGSVYNSTFIPSEQELTYRLGRGMLTYTKLDDGRFVPIWEETVI